MAHTVLRREFSDLIDLDPTVDRLAGGFTLTEGPIMSIASSRAPSQGNSLSKRRPNMS
jgi:hypothetical protein